MTIPATPRFALPLLAPGQAQKELTHNEALQLIDALIDARIVAANAVTPPTTAAPGSCWALGAAPTGAWSGQGNALAIATEGGWRFCRVGQGFAVRAASDGRCWTLSAAGWIAAPTIALPTGGSVIDSEARAAIAAIRAALIGAGIVI